MSIKFIIIYIFCSLSWSNLVYGESLSIKNCSILPKLGQMFMVRLPVLSSKMSHENEVAYLKAYSQNLSNLYIGGAIIFSSNIKKTKSPSDISDYIKTFQEGRDIGMFIATDQEGGKVQRMGANKGFTKLPSAKEIGLQSIKEEGLDRDIAYAFGVLTAKELHAVGVNWNFAPVLDIETNPNNPIIAKFSRALSSDPEIVSILGNSIIRGMAENGVIPTAKHFPGHGDTTSDSHYGYAQVNKTYEELEKQELIPFIGAIENGIDSIMVGHLNLPKIEKEEGLPASLSKYIITGILREKLGFNGLIVTDDLVMGAITKYFSPEDAALKAILAGNDVLIIGANKEEQVIRHICNEFNKGTNRSRDLLLRINESYERIIFIKKKYQIYD